MSSDEFSLKTPLLSFSVKKSERQIIINDGETIIIRFWNWKKFTFIRKAISVRNGIPEVIVL